jgi:hypothetical protein
MVEAPSPNDRRRRSAVVVAAMLGLASLWLGGCGGTSGPAPPHLRSNLISIVQEDGLFQEDPAALVRRAAQIGAQALRADVFWSHIAPDPAASTAPSFDASQPGAYPAAGWAVYDAADRAAAADHVRLYLTLTGPPPLWAAGAGMPTVKNCPCSQWAPSASDFGAFVHAVGLRYSGHYTPPGQSQPLPRVSFWSIWNEPNYGPNLAPQAIDGSKIEVSPRLYRGLVDAAWRGLASSGHAPPADTVLIGETAPRGLSGPNLPGNFSGMLPLRFVRALYCVDSAYKPLRGQAASLRGCPTDAAGSAAFPREHPGLFQASGWADHPYPDELAPDVPTTFEPDYADFADLGRFERGLDRATGPYSEHPHLPILSTEFGYKTDPPFPAGLALATAARYLNQAEYLSWRSSRIRSYDQYLLVDPPASSGSQFDTGIEFADGRPKPDVYNSFLMPLWLPRTTGRRLEVWGCARQAPARAAASGRPQTVVLEFAASGGSVFRPVARATLSPRGGCYFDTRISIPGPGTVRTAWRNGRTVVRSRTQSVS